MSFKFANVPSCSSNILVSFFERTSTIISKHPQSSFKMLSINGWERLWVNNFDEHEHLQGRQLVVSIIADLPKIGADVEEYVEQQAQEEELEEAAASLCNAANVTLQSWFSSYVYLWTDGTYPSNVFCGPCTSTVTCTGVVPEVCIDIPCSADDDTEDILFGFQCTPSSAESNVTACSPTKYEIEYKIVNVTSESYEYVRIEMVDFFTRGVQNYASFNYSLFYNESGNVKGCGLEYDGQACQQCEICRNETNGELYGFSTDCSNLKPDYEPLICDGFGISLSLLQMLVFDGSVNRTVPADFFPMSSSAGTIGTPVSPLVFFVGVGMMLKSLY